METPKDDLKDDLKQDANDELKQDAKDIATETPTELPADALKNVVPFRPPGETKPPSLSPVENTAFNELARQLSARLETENGNEASPAAPIEAVFEPSAASAAREPAGEPPEWLAPPEPPAHGEARRDKALLDLLPVGILIYRLDRLLYANPAFLVQMGYPGLHALEDAGGLDALYVEPGVSSASSTSDTGKPVRISATQPADTRRAAGGGRCPPLHDFMGRRFRPRPDLFEHAPGSRGDRGGDLRSNAGSGDRRRRTRRKSDAEPSAVGPCQRRRTRRHPRHHGRRHRDVRRRGQHQLGQSQRRSAVRL